MVAVQVLPLTKFVFNTEAHPLPLKTSARHAALRPKCAQPVPGVDLEAAQYSAEALQTLLDAFQQQLSPR